jgi:hypothetical protein
MRASIGAAAETIISCFCHRLTPDLQSSLGILLPDDPSAEASSNPDEVLIQIWELCVAAADLIDPIATPALHAAMQTLLNALGMEMGRRVRGPSH